MEEKVMSKITESARGEQCTMKLPWIHWHNPETVVFAHSNKLKHGKGMGKKASDEFGAYLCYRCHAIVDGHEKRPDYITKEYIDNMFDEAIEKTRGILRQKGLL